MVEEAQMYSGSGRRSVAQMWSPSSSWSSGRLSVLMSGPKSGLSSSASSTKARSGPVRQALIWWMSSFLALHSSLSLAWQLVQHQGRNLDILTIQVWKHISGLCFLSHVKPRIMLCLLSQVTARSSAWRSGLVQSFVHFCKTKTKTSPHKLEDPKKLDQTNINWFRAVLCSFLWLQDRSKPVYSSDQFTTSLESSR